MGARSSDGAAAGHGGDADGAAAGGHDADALGADRFEHLASPEAGWAVPGVTGLGAGRVGDGGVNGDEADGSNDLETGVGSQDAGADDAGADGAGAVSDGNGLGRRDATGSVGAGIVGGHGAGADDADGTHAGSEDAGWGGRLGMSQASEDPDRFLGFDALALLNELELLNGRLSAVVATADAHGSRRLAERLTPLLRTLEATYDRAIGQAAAGGGFASSGHGSARTWLADATNVTRTAAGGVLADAEFLDRQPEISAARDAGGMSWQHVAVFRKTLTAQPWREARFPTVADFFVTVAQGVDPTELRRHLQGWAQAVDDQEAPDRPDTPYVERALHLRQVGELWDVRGTLPMLEGATLAGVLDEVIAAARRKACVCGTDPCTCPKDLTPRATKRADALTALANWATAHRTCLHDDPLLSAGGAQRSRPTILVPLDRLAPHQVPATLADYFASHPPAPRTPHGGCTSCDSSRGGSGGRGSRGSSSDHGSGQRSGSGQDDVRIHGGARHSGDGQEGGRVHGGSHFSGSSHGSGSGQNGRHGSVIGHLENSDPTAIEGQDSASCTHTTPTSDTATGAPMAGATAADGIKANGAAAGGATTGGAAAASDTNVTATGGTEAIGTAVGGVAPAGTETINGVRFTARELNEGLAGLGVSQVRWYAGSESGTLNRRDTEVELCDATVARIITTPEGYPLDVGHDTRVINPGLRAALIARDGGCIIPSCVTPATWCDGHHVIPWAAGGITAMSNLALTCREHHRAIHAGQWTITFTDDGLPQAKSRDIRTLHPYRRHRRR